MSSNRLDPKRYEPDEDGLLREIVGPWVKEKHARLERYVGISREVRKKFVGPGTAGATFIDLFSGPGRARIKDDSEVIRGSPLVAWLESVKGEAAFTQVHIADAERVLMEACEARLKDVAAPMLAELGPAVETVDRVIARLNIYGLHFAFLDPYNLEALPFEVIRKLAAIKRMDILLHVSVQDLQRNLRKYIKREGSPLDAFAPGWRDNVDTERSDFLVRAKILEHWRSLVDAEGMTTAKTFEKVTGTRQQPLYWLAFAARHERALEFWEKIRDVSSEKQQSLF